MNKKKLTPILEGKYEVIGVKPGPIGTPLGVVDLSRITEAMADRLVKANSSYIRKTKPKAQKVTKTDNPPQEKEREQ